MFLFFIINPETNEMVKFHLTVGSQILIPKNVAHGFLTLQENSILIYHFNGVFKNAKQFKFKIDLPDNVIMSEADK